MKWLIALFFLFQLSREHNLEINLKQQLINYADSLATIISNKEIALSFECENNLTHYGHGLRTGEAWALKMYDAKAKVPPSGIFEGNLFNLGFYDECLNSEKDNKQVLAKYCLGRIVIENPMNKTSERASLSLLLNDKINVYMAKCFPEGCSIREMERVYARLDGKIDLVQKFCQSKLSQPKADKAATAGICTFGILLAVVTCSTFYDVVCQYKGKEPRHSLLFAFSLPRNVKALISTSSGPSDITCLHGIRVFSMIWIVTSHRFDVLADFPVFNTQYFLDWTSGEKSMPLHVVYLAVDTFFMLSGLLVSYNYMLNVKRGIRFNAVSHYFYRYLRLTPQLSVLIIFNVTLLRHVGSGPLWKQYIEEDLITGCEKYWWRTLLYIQNIPNPDNLLCIHPIWYLSVDMQLFILSPLLLLPLSRRPNITLFCTGILAFCSTLSGVFIAWYYDLHPLGLANRDAATVSNYFWYYLYTPYVNAAPWLMGFILGYYTFKSKTGKCKLSTKKDVILIVWILSVGIIFACTFVGRELITAEYNRVAYSLYIFIASPVWCVAIGWVIFACYNGCGGSINRFLSFPILQIMSKVTYCLFLVHIVVVTSEIAKKRTPPSFSSFQLIFDVCGDYVFSFVFAVILTLTVELPMNTLIKYMKKSS